MWNVRRSWFRPWQRLIHRSGRAQNGLGPKPSIASRPRWPSSAQPDRAPARGPHRNATVQPVSRRPRSAPEERIRDDPDDPIELSERPEPHRSHPPAPCRSQNFEFEPLDSSPGRRQFQDTRAYGQCIRTPAGGPPRQFEAANPPNFPTTP